MKTFSSSHIYIMYILLCYICYTILYISYHIHIKYIYVYIYTNLPVNAIVRLPHPRSGDGESNM